jgi:hypothetical protein
LVYRPLEYCLIHYVCDYNRKFHLNYVKTGGIVRNVTYISYKNRKKKKYFTTKQGEIENKLQQHNYYVK